MDARKLTAILLVSVLLTIAVPLIASDDGDATGTVETDGKVDVTVQGGGDGIIFDLDSNGSTTVEVYVTNLTENRMSLRVSDIDTDAISSTSTITVNGLTSNLIYPTNDSEYRDLAVIRVTLTSSELADTQDFSGSISLQFTTIETGEVTVVEIPVTGHITSVFTSEGAYNKFFGLIPNTLPAPLNDTWFTALSTLVLWILATIVVCELLIPFSLKMFRNKGDPLERKKITNALTKTISVLMLVIAVNECLNIVGANAEVMSAVARFSTVLYVIIGAVLSWQIYVFLITKIIKGVDEGLDVDGIDSSLIPLFKMIGKLVICVVAATVILAAYGVDLAGIMVSAGVITLGITFGAQEIISQFFSGIVLLSTRPFKKGDFVSINGTTYIVHKVKIMYTEFQSWDKDQIITMPNNVVTAATMINYTKGNPNTRIYIYVSVAYDANLTLAKELMIKAANMHPHVIKDKTVIPPSTRLTNFLDSGIEYRLACYVDDYDNSAHYAGQIREIIYKLFLDNNIEIPYNRLQLDILSDCDGKRRPDDESPEA